MTTALIWTRCAHVRWQWSDARSQQTPELPVFVQRTHSITAWLVVVALQSLVKPCQSSIISL
ncbi:hypothetical protein PAXRUDRAFT_606771 [Paxillus rubicundulus Ve08.2h10]|uniref:Uncharacterized protein n=1 Tax=Paxillus rubicundulus Ve08.2h10 TaxID=930991 RepID=A0A0D0DYV5_9AGAM|nr:hypothetical protein PAXRUDRAFT_606771 [Paxillus rubicundulus Ve08.2h10]